MTFEDEVGEALRRQAEAVEPSDDAWERIEERSRRPALARWQLTTLAAVAAAVVVLAAVVGVRVLRNDGKDTQQVAAGGGDPSTTTAFEPTTTTAPDRTTTTDPVTTTEPPTTTVPPPTTSSSTTAPPTTDTTVPPETTTTTTSAGPLVRPSDRLEWAVLGSIAVGQTVADLERSTGVDVETSYASEDRSCGFLVSDELPPGVWVMIADDVVMRIEVTGLDAEGDPIDQPITEEAGLGIDSTEREVLDTYGDAVTVEPHPYDEDGHYLVVEPPDHVPPAILMIMETDGQRVTSFRAGQEEYVRLIEGCA